MTYGSGALALVDEDLRPLMAGFPFAVDRPGPMRVFPLRINTGRDPTYPDFYPEINRAIAPGKSDAYRFTLRFGAPVTKPYQFAPDAYERLKLAYPAQLNWKDRRPIASLILATASTGWQSNPRGWLLDSSIDVNTIRGRKLLRERVMAWADGSIAIMKRMNAQGMITWDIEGEQYSHPTTYIGDPRLVSRLAPEMDSIADEYFKRFRDAGFRVGVCIRPQEIQINGSNLLQRDAGDPDEIMLAKIAYARERWGATLFYVDSNGDPGNPMPPDVFARIAKQNPDVLLIPEQQTLGYFGSTAPYRELRSGWAAAPALARQLYPAGFAVINTADGDISGQRDQLRRAAAQGDVLMFRGWFDDPGNVILRSILH
jgi:hypothetical protein